MKLPTNTLKNLTISAGIATALAGSASAKDIEAPKPVRTICKAAPIKSESKTIKEIFSTADINKDGKLSAEEFNKAYLAIVVQEKAKAAKAAKIKHPKTRVHIDNCPGCGLG